jgi:HD-GYP domain-containing protein (c-di-GMP phosphodiesterase class II)
MVKRSSVELLSETIAGNKDYIDACISEDVPVICVSRETKDNKYMPFKVMYENNPKFWLQNEAWEYFISKEDYAKVQEAVARQNSQWEPSQTNTEAEENDITRSFGKDYSTIANMTDDERVQQLKEDKDRLESLIAQKPRQQKLITEALVETAQDAMLHNHVALANAAALPNTEAKKQTQELVNSTNDLVKASTKLITTDIFNDELMNTLVAKSNGTTIQHMTRVFLNGLAFLSYYNNLVSTSSMINKLRTSIDKRHKAFYQILLPDVHPDFINLEKIFLGGMRAISENNFQSWATGFLIHDIGKAAAIEYHEGEAAYNRDLVTEHVKIGYTSVMNKTNYPREAGLITGYHHEYYGDTSGYGYFRSYLDDYKKANPLAKHGSCIAFELAPMLDFEAVAFFPAKVLEIIDVFDSVTDPNRKYHKAMTTEEALAMMQEEFINKHPKIDLILFEIFSKFVQEKPSS